MSEHDSPHGQSETAIDEMMVNVMLKRQHAMNRLVDQQVKPLPVNFEQLSVQAQFKHIYDEIVNSSAAQYRNIQTISENFHNRLTQINDLIKISQDEQSSHRKQDNHIIYDQVVTCQKQLQALDQQIEDLYSKHKAQQLTDQSLANQLKQIQTSLASQLSDQRQQLSVDMGLHRQQVMDEIAGQLQTVIEQSETAQSSFQDSTLAQLNYLQAKIHANSENQSKLQLSNEVSIGQLTSQAQNQAHEIAEINRDIAEIQNTHNSNFSDIQSDVNKLGEGIEGLQQQMDAKNGHFNKVVQDLQLTVQKLSSQTENYGAAFQSYQQQQDMAGKHIQGRISGLEQQQDALSRSLKNQTEPYDELKQQIQDVQSQVQLKNKELQDSNTLLNSKMNQVSAKMTKFEQLQTQSQQLQIQMQDLQQFKQKSKDFTEQCLLQILNSDQIYDTKFGKDLRAYQTQMKDNLAQIQLQNVQFQLQLSKDNQDFKNELTAKVELIQQQIQSTALKQNQLISELSSSIQHRSTEFNDMVQDAVTKMETSILERVNAQLRELQNKVSTNHTTVHGQIQQIMSYQNDLKQFKQQVTQQIAQLNQANSETLTQCADKINHQNELIQNVVQETAEQLLEIQGQTQSNKVDQAQISQLQQDISTLNSQLDERIKTNNDELQLRIFQNLKGGFDSQLKQNHEGAVQLVNGATQQIKDLQHDVKIIGQVLNQLDQQIAELNGHMDTSKQSLSKTVSYVDGQISRFQDEYNDIREQINGQLTQHEEAMGQLSTKLRQEYGKQIALLTQHAGRSRVDQKELPQDNLAEQFYMIQAQMNQILPLVLVSDNNQDDGMFMRLIKQLQHDLSDTKHQINALGQHSSYLQQQEQLQEQILEAKQDLQGQFDAFTMQLSAQVENIKQSQQQDANSIRNSNRQVIQNLISTSENILKQVIPEQVLALDSKIQSLRLYINDVQQNLQKQLLQNNSADTQGQLQLGIVLKPVAQHIQQVQQQVLDMQAKYAKLSFDRAGESASTGQEALSGQIHASVQEMQQQIKHLQQQLGDASANAQESCGRQISLLEQKLTTKLGQGREQQDAKYEERLSSLQNQIIQVKNSHNDYLDTCQAKIPEINGLIARLATDVAQLNSSSAAINTQIAKINKQLERPHDSKQIDELREENSRAQATLRSLQDTYKALNSEIGDKAEQLLVIESLMGNLQQQFGQYQLDCKLLLNQETEAIRQQYQQLVDNIDVSNTKIHNFQTIQDQFQTQLEDNYSRCSDSIKKTNEQLTELGSRVSTITQTVSEYHQGQDLLNNQLNHSIESQAKALQMSQNNTTTLITDYKEEVIQAIDRKYSAQNEQLSQFIATKFQQASQDEKAMQTQINNQIKAYQENLQQRYQAVLGQFGEKQELMQQNFDQLLTQNQTNQQNYKKQYEETRQMYQSQVNQLMLSIAQYQQLTQQISNNFETRATEKFVQLKSLVDAQTREMENWLGKQINQVANHLQMYGTHLSLLTTKLDKFGGQCDERFSRVNMQINLLEQQTCQKIDTSNKAINRASTDMDGVLQQVDIINKQQQDLQQYSKNVENKVVEQIALQNEKASIDKVQIEKLAADLRGRVDHAVTMFGKLEQDVYSKLGDIFNIKEKDSVQFSQQALGKYSGQPQFNNFSEFDPVDAQVSKQSIKLYKELVDRNIETQSFTIFKLKPNTYDIMNKRVYVVSNRDGIYVKTGSGMIPFVEWVYDLLVGK